LPLFVFMGAALLEGEANMARAQSPKVKFENV
jgi:hypothetical protein